MIRAFSGFFRGKIWRFGFFAYLCTRNYETPLAEIAQLVERNLAKVEVAGPSPVFRSRGGRKRGLKESKKPCISAIYKAFSYILPLLLKQKAASIPHFNRNLFYPDRKQATIWIYFADLHHFTPQHPGAEDVLFTQKPSSHVPRITFSVVFFCKMTKVMKKGKVPIYARITTTGQSK